MAQKITRIQIRRDVSTTWTSVNPTLSLGEWALETDTRKLKIGDGTREWKLLPYFEGSGGGGDFQGGPISIDLTPDSDGNVSLGGQTNRFKEIFVKQFIHLGDQTSTEALLSADDTGLFVSFDGGTNTKVVATGTESLELDNVNVSGFSAINSFVLPDAAAITNQAKANSYFLDSVNYIDESMVETNDFSSPFVTPNFPSLGQGPIARTPEDGEIFIHNGPDASTAHTDYTGIDGTTLKVGDTFMWDAGAMGGAKWIKINSTGSGGGGADLSALGVTNVGTAPQGEIEKTTDSNINFKQVAKATDSTLGVVSAGNNIDIDTDGEISVPTATATELGVVKVPSASAVTLSSGDLDVQVASATELGVVKVDDTTIKVDSNGVLAAQIASPIVNVGSIDATADAPDVADKGGDPFVPGEFYVNTGDGPIVAGWDPTISAGTTIAAGDMLMYLASGWSVAGNISNVDLSDYIKKSGDTGIGSLTFTGGNVLAGTGISTISQGLKIETAEFQVDGDLVGSHFIPNY